MGNTDERFLTQIEPLIAEKWQILYTYHGENAIKIKNFAILLAKLGHIEQAKRLIYRACNDWRTDIPTIKKRSIWQKIKQGVKKWLDIR